MIVSLLSIRLRNGFDESETWGRGKKILIKGREKLTKFFGGKRGRVCHCAHIDMGELVILREAIQGR